MPEPPKYPEGAVAVAMFIGSDQWYMLTEFVDPAAGRPTGWVEAKEGRTQIVWVDLALAFKVFVYDEEGMRAAEEAILARTVEEWTTRAARR